MVPRGLEPRTLRLLAVRSNQLSCGLVRNLQVRDSCPTALSVDLHIAPREARAPDLEANSLTL